MSKRELIDRELDCLAERDLDDLLVFLKSIRESHFEASLPLAADSSLAKDWLTTGEDAAWASL